RRPDHESGTADPDGPLGGAFLRHDHHGTSTGARPAPPGPAAPWQRGATRTARRALVRYGEPAAHRCAAECRCPVPHRASRVGQDGHSRSPRTSRSTMVDQDLRSTALEAVHRSLGATFTDFAGWQMPVRYDSDLAEHRAVRESAGIFDLSHMGEIHLRGPQAGEALDHALAGKLSAMSVGRAKYSLLLTEDGGAIDDVITYRLAQDHFLVVAKYSNAETDSHELRERTRGPAGA